MKKGNKRIAPNILVYCPLGETLRCLSQCTVVRRDHGAPKPANIGGGGDSTLFACHGGSSMPHHLFIGVLRRFR